MTTKENTIKIINGRSYSHIIDALKYAYNKKSPMVATFTTEHGAKIELIVKSFAHKDKLGKEIIVRGKIKLILLGHMKVYYKKIINIDYNSRTRTGSIFFNNVDDYNEFTRIPGMKK